MARFRKSRSTIEDRQEIYNQTSQVYRDYLRVASHEELVDYYNDHNTPHLAFPEKMDRAQLTALILFSAMRRMVGD